MYDRYAILKNSDGSVEQMPFINLPINSSDKYISWNSNYMRLDKFSQSYYGSPFYDFLILYGNPNFVSEWDIPDGTVIRIPFPLQKVKADYEAILNDFMDK